MRLIFPLAAVAGALGLTAPLPQSDCAEPSIVIEGSPSSGETVVIEADGFAAGCGEADSEGSAESGSETGTGAAGGCSVEGSATGAEGSATGAGRSTEDIGSGQPVQNIRVTIIQDGETYVLAVRDGEESSGIRIETELPEELHEGSATLHAEGDSGEDAEVTVTVVERR